MAGEPNSNANVPPVETDAGDGAPPVMIEIPQEDGSVKKLTAKEAAAAVSRAYEKEAGADRKFKQIAKEQKENARKAEGFDLYTAANRRDRDAARRLAREFPEYGITPETVESFITQWDAEEAAAQNKGQHNQVNNNQQARREKLTIEDLPDEAVDVLQRSRKQQLEQIRQQHHSTLDKALDNDEVLTDIMHPTSGVTDGQRKLIRAHARELLARRVREAVGTTPDFTLSQADFVTVAREAREFANEMLGGVQPADVQSRRSVPGASLGRSPAPGVSSLHRPNKQLKQVSPDSPEYTNFLLQRTEQIMRSGEHDNFDL